MLSRPRSRAFVRWLPGLLTLAFLFLLSTTPHLQIMPIPAEDLLVRKLGHASAYGILALTVRLALTSGSRFARPAALRDWVLPLLVVLAIAISDEAIQSVTDGREAKVTDVVIDSVGAIAVLVLARSWRYRSTAIETGDGGWMARARRGVRRYGGC